MKLFIIHTGYGLTDEQLSVRVSKMKTGVSADTDITMECLSHTRVDIDSQLDVAVAAPEIIEKAIEAQQNGYDAIGIYCTSDPALRACREAVRIPVIGAGQAAFATAMMLGDSWSFITTSQSRISEKREFARQCGIDITRLASIRSVPCTTSDGSPIPEDILKKRLLETVFTCKTKDHADVVILGCLSYAGLGQELTLASKIPVIDPAQVLSATAEALVRQNLSHSKQSFSHPPKGVRQWEGGKIHII